jgi:hypothetical protein
VQRIVRAYAARDAAKRGNGPKRHE